MLDAELTARDVPRPVVEMTDNHDSRYADEVLEFCQSKGIIQWSEKANTSGKFQALDQVNRKLHMEMAKAMREFKRERLLQLNLARLEDAHPLDISDMKDIEKHTSTAPPSVTEFKGSPLGVRKGSSEYYKRKIEAYKYLASAWETYETSPIEQGILNPEILPSLPPKANKGRLSDNNGSFEFNDILGRKCAPKHAEQQAAREHSCLGKVWRRLHVPFAIC
ncbi:hypothetical protein CYMTET_50478 [Cymbomonas tetramitiformis]|uniref:Uncharacterized protein n=1 Tax=Cymbomonas tetramitiformis TaxID=36881 RepID=A0AAE0ETF7_9CHLO|nr:hypothetical protein CYMTET_50478 [Cymbomonas tetramitiformis]